MKLKKFNESVNVADLSALLEENGAEGFAILISKAIDKAGPVNGLSIHELRKKITNKLLELNKLINREAIIKKVSKFLQDILITKKSPSI